jgi:23S rRNA maturation-related 3'-5' exoribonuclease YhaM
VTKKPAGGGNTQITRAVTDELRRQVRGELPEVAEISDQPLQDKPVEAWAFALAHSSFTSIRDIPPAGNPDTNEAKRGDQTDHLRGVARLAVGIAREMGTIYPELAIDMDIIIAGGLLHDVGKAWEFDRINRRRWKLSQRKFGRP